MWVFESVLCVCVCCACVQVRNFKWLNFRVPFSIVNQANQANQLYPHAVSLMESIKTYELMCTRVRQPRQYDVVSVQSMC